MEAIRVSFALILSLMVLWQTVQCSKINKLEKGINFLKDKISTMEENVFQDKIRIYDEIQIIWKLLNNSDELVDNQDETGWSAADEHKFGHDEYGGSEMRKVLTIVNERIAALLTGFRDEKMSIRNVMNDFENQFKLMKDKQDEAVMNINDYASHQLSYINQTLQEESGIAIKHIEQILSNLKVEQLKVIAHLKDNADQIHADLNDTLAEGLKGLVEVQERANEKTVTIVELFNDVQDTVNVYSAKFDKLQKTVSDIQNGPLFQCGSYAWKIIGNMCYKGSTAVANWNKAEKECTKMGATLVKADSIKQQFFGTFGFLYIWVDFDLPGVPLSALCFRVSLNQYYLDNHPCEEQLNFLCEMRPLI